MPERSLVSLEQLKVDIQLLSREAEILRPSEAAMQREFQRTASAMDAYLEQSKHIGALKLTIGRTAIAAIQFSSPHGHPDVHRELVRPGANFFLAIRREITTEPFSALPEQRVTEPVYGLTHYFDLASIGVTLADGGDLTLQRE